MRVTAAILVLALGAGPAIAQPGGQRTGTEVTVIVRDAARQRTSPGGEALAALVGDSGRLTELSAAWDDFAQELGWTTAQTFDALLGSRVMVVMRDVTPAGAQHWAVLSEVSSEAEKRLISALRPAPRGTAGGYTLLAIERGRYELAIARGGWRDNTAQPAVILLAPAEDRQLFDELVPSLAAPRFAGTGENEAGDAALIIRRPAPPAFDGGAPRSTTMTLSAVLDADGAGWTCRLLGDAGTVSPITPWSTAAFEGLQQDGMVAVMGVLGAPPLSDLGPWLGLPGVSMPKDSLIGQRVALVVRGGGGRTVAPLASGAVHLAAHRDTQASSLAVTLAIESYDLPALIPAADTLSASLVPFLNGQEPAPVAAAVEFDTGLRERSVRAVDLFPAKGSLAAGFAPSPMLTWAFARSRPSFQQMAGVKRRGAESPGWWVLSLSSGEAVHQTGTPTEIVRDLLTREMPDPMQVQRLSVGIVRPAELESAPGLPEALTEALRGARRVESVRWDSWLRADGRAEGEVRVRMNPAAR